MVRHETIHKNKTSTTRQRCHTACKACRSSHGKCNGESPCNICSIRNITCTYGPTSRRVSRRVGGAAEAPSVGVEGDVPREQGDSNTEQHVQKHDRTVNPQSPLSPVSEAASSTCPPEELVIFAQGIHPESNKTDMMQIDCYGNESNDMASPNFSDFMMPDFPDLPDLTEGNVTLSLDSGQFPITDTDPRALEKNPSLSDINVALQPPESDIIPKNPNKSTTESQQKVIQIADQLDGADRDAATENSSFMLPELHENSTADCKIATDNISARHSHSEAVADERVLCWDASDILQQPADADLFTSLFNAPDLPYSASTGKLNGLRSDSTSMYLQASQPLPFELAELGQKQTLPASPPPETDKILSSKRPASGGHPTNCSSAQMELVWELFHYATTSLDISPEERSCHWKAASIKVCNTFDITLSWDHQDCALYQMVYLYKQNLHSLWPMIFEPGLQDPSRLHPVLFLVAASNGVMYLEDDKADVFGTMMHRCLQTSLITSFIESEMAEDDTIWLAQARNTIQVVSLYFGQGQELAYTQRLGAALVSQSRHMGLFRLTGLEDCPAGATPEEKLAAWIRAETRRRVAFGIYRADVFQSLLTNCPPCISADELQITLPYPDSLWMSVGKLPVEEALAAVERERAKRTETRFCDLMRILRDRDEVLVSMEARDYELLLFGLQEQVWKFSHDPDIFQRLTGHSWQDAPDAGSLDAEINRVFNSSDMDAWDHLELRHREMKDLLRERRQLSMALEKWLQSFNTSRFQLCPNTDRGRILSSLLLFHIHHLQLNASLDVLHHIADGLCNKMTIDDKRLRMAIGWAHNAQARSATYHASKIWSLLDNEAKMNPMKKPRYNLLAFMGLHHASVVLWTCSGARRAPHELPLSFARNDSWGNRGGSHYDRFEEMLRSITLLYSRLKSMSWDAFAGRVLTLSSSPFPRQK
ncbi:hypothetical protein ACKLNR_014583 [Fusarium oxysporum f. sp. zingiberi]